MLLALCALGACMMQPHATARLVPARVCHPAAGRCGIPRRARVRAVSDAPRTEVETEPRLDEAELALERREWRRSIRSDVLRFAGPALAGVLADPLMSVIDALCCGRFCSTLQA